MKISIIGANSFIARNLIYYVKSKLIDEDVTFYLYDFAEGHIDGESSYEKIDVLSEKSISRVNFDVDILYIFVGKTGTSQGFDDIDTYIDINEKSLLNIMNVYRKKNSRAKLVFPSSRLVYKGKPGWLTEDDEEDSKTIYAVNKRACEEYLKLYNVIFDVQYVIFRICVPYGSMLPEATSYGTAEFMLSKAKNGEDISLYGDGSQRRTLTAMEDLCATLYYASINDKCLNDVYNIGGEDYSLFDMAKGIAKKYGVGVTHVEWPEMAMKIESGDTVFNSHKLDSIIDYTRKCRFEEWI